MSGPDLYVLTVGFLALKKTGFSEEKNSSQKKKFFFYLFSMQLFSADATMFSKYIFFDHKKLKKTPPKVAQKYSIFFQPCAAKRLKKKNSVLKMWLKKSLSIALGSQCIFQI